MSKLKKKDIEEEKEETTEEEAEAEEEVDEETTEEDTDEKVDEVVEKISKSLNLSDLQAKVDKIIGKDEMAKKIFVSSDVKKDVNDLSADEKIVGFFSALVKNDKIALKALSEGVAADFKIPQVCFSM